MARGALPAVTFRDIFVLLGNDLQRPAIQASNGGVMKAKKQPSRDDLAAALITIRGQAQIIRLQTEKIRELEQLMGHVLLVYPRLEELRVN